MSRKKPPAAEPGVRPAAESVPRGLPPALATVAAADIDHLPADYRDRTAFVPNPYEGMPARADLGLRFTLAQAAAVTPAVAAVAACRAALKGVPNLYAPPRYTEEPAPEHPAPVLPAVLADAFARLVVELDRVLYLAGRL